MSTPSKLSRKRAAGEDSGSQTTPRRRSSAAASNGGTPDRRAGGHASEGSSQDMIPPSSQDIPPQQHHSPGSLTPSQGDLLSSQRGFASPSRDALLSSQGSNRMENSSPLRYGSPSSRGDRGSSRGALRSISSTPLRQRADIQRGGRDVHVMVNEASQEGTSGGASEAVIWGTDVSVEKCKHLFKTFLTSFVEVSADTDERFQGMDAHLPIYLQRLDEINLIGEPFLNFNCEHLRKFDSSLHRQLLCYPQEVIPTFDVATNEVFFNKYPDSSLEHQIQVRPYNSARPKSMRSLNPEDIDQLITVSGMVIRTSSLIPEMREAYFECNICTKGEVVETERGRIIEPVLCRNCNTKHSFHLVHNRSLFTDKQLVKLQESPEDMPVGQTPHTMVVFAHGDLVDKVQPGDRITITGIYRASPLRINPRQRNVLAVYKTHFDVVHYRKLDHKRLHELSPGDDDDAGDGKEMHLSEERIGELKELSKSPGIYEALASALAPSVYENVDVKKGILLQLFSGARKEFTNSGRGRFRSDINILLCGDPGTSKSQLLQYVYSLIPRGQYTSGKGSSAVGLTAYVTKDPETGQLVLQTGALVLSDNGVCCIDEFDKMNEGTRSVLHEVMEQQTLSIAKAGIICTLNARTSVLAAANPIESKWNKNKTIIDNIQLPHTLLSRFDLIFLILDPQDEVFDRRLAYHLISLYYKAPEVLAEGSLDLSTLKDYIGYARTHIQPVISEQAGLLLVESYVEMRKIGSGRGQVSAYPRQLESLIRLAEAHARMRLSNEVNVEDVKEARRLHKEALKQAAIDPSTGKIDVSILTTGITGAARKLRATRASQLLAVMQSKGRVLNFKYNQLFEDFKAKLMEAGETFVTYETFDNALRDLQDDNEIIRTGNNIRRTNP